MRRVHTLVKRLAAPIAWRGTDADIARLASRIRTAEIGKRADLLLLDHNPLEGVANLASRRGVAVRGHWLPREDLNSMLAALD
jgi:hypothetical protein